jgi:hypothetical protein
VTVSPLDLSSSADAVSLSAYGQASNGSSAANVAVDATVKTRSESIEPHASLVSADAETKDGSSAAVVLDTDEQQTRLVDGSSTVEMSSQKE